MHQWSGSLIFTFSNEPDLPGHEILQRDQKKTGLSKYGISFSFVCLGFLPKIKKCQKHVFVIFEWSGFFGAKRAVSPFIIYHCLTLCQKSKKSLERLSGKSVYELTTPDIAQLKLRNELPIALLVPFIKIVLVPFRNQNFWSWSFSYSCDRTLSC